MNSTQYFTVSSCWTMSPFVFILAGVSGTDMMLSLPVNIRVVWLLLGARRGSLTLDFFTFNLTVMELTIILLTLVQFADVMDLPLGLTKTIDFFFALTLIGRPLSQCCICVERHMAVVHPIAFLKYKALRYKLLCLAVVWLITIVLSLVNVFTISYYLFTGIFIPTLAIESFCSFSILRVLKQPRPGDKEKDNINLMKRKAFITVLAILVAMVFNYFPLVIATCLAPLFTPEYCNCKMFPYAFLFSYVGNFVHPLLYLTRAQKLPCIRDCWVANV